MNPDISSITASPSGSLILTSSSFASLEEKKESKAVSEADGEPETIAITSSEAVRQKSHKLANFSAQPQEIPEKYKRKGFKFGVNSILQQKSSHRYVMVKQLPGVGIRFQAKSYLCEWLEPLSSDPDTTAWIDQSDLKKVK